MSPSWLGPSRRCPRAAYLPALSPGATGVPSAGSPSGAEGGNLGLCGWDTPSGKPFVASCPRYQFGAIPYCGFPACHPSVGAHSWDLWGLGRGFCPPRLGDGGPGSAPGRRGPKGLMTPPHIREASAFLGYRDARRTDGFKS